MSRLSPERVQRILHGAWRNGGFMPAPIVAKKYGVRVTEVERIFESFENHAVHVDMPQRWHSGPGISLERPTGKKARTTFNAFDGVRP
jgi:hypothetical protein